MAWWVLCYFRAMKNMLDCTCPFLTSRHHFRLKRQLDRESKQKQLPKWHHTIASFRWILWMLKRISPMSLAEKTPQCKDRSRTAHSRFASCRSKSSTATHTRYKLAKLKAIGNTAGKNGLRRRHFIYKDRYEAIYWELAIPKYTLWYAWKNKKK